MCLVRADHEDVRHLRVTDLLNIMAIIGIRLKRTKKSCNRHCLCER